MRTRARLLVMAALAALPATLSAQPVPVSTEPYTLEGVVATDQAGAQEAGWFAVSIGVIGDDAPARWVGVTAFKTWDDDPFVGREDLRRLMPSQPTLLFVGPAGLVKQFQQAPPGSKLVVRGMLNKASRNFMLSGIKVTSPSGGTGK